MMMLRWVGGRLDGGEAGAWMIVRSALGWAVVAAMAVRRVWFGVPMAGVRSGIRTGVFLLLRAFLHACSFFTRGFGRFGY